MDVSTRPKSSSKDMGELQRDYQGQVKYGSTHQLFRSGDSTDDPGGSSHRVVAHHIGHEEEVMLCLHFFALLRHGLFIMWVCLVR